MSFKSLIARLLQTARNQVYRLDDLAIKQGTKFADTTLNTFENKIENKIGTPLPIDFSIDELLDGKLTNLSPLTTFFLPSIISCLSTTPTILPTKS